MTLRKLIDGIGHLAALLAIAMVIIMLCSRPRWVRFHPYDEIGSWALLVSMVCLSIGCRSRLASLLLMVSGVALTLTNGYLNLVLLEPLSGLFDVSFDARYWGRYRYETLMFLAMPFLIAISLQLELRASKWVYRRGLHAVIASLIWAALVFWDGKYFWGQSVRGIVRDVALIVWLGYFACLTGAVVVFLGRKKFGRQKEESEEPKSQLKLEVAGAVN